nr:phosphoserine phosphatase, chloroplastic [Tanacetum cinerariifolium]
MEAALSNEHDVESKKPQGLNEVKRLKKKLNHKVVGVIHEARKKTIRLTTGLKGRVNRLLIKRVIRDGTGRKNKNRIKASGRIQMDEWLSCFFMPSERKASPAVGYIGYRGNPHIGYKKISRAEIVKMILYTKTEDDEKADKAGKSKSSSEVVGKEASTEIGKEKRFLTYGKKVDVVCFNVDSTVCTDKGIDELAEFCRVGKAVAKWTVKRAL